MQLAGLGSICHQYLWPAIQNSSPVVRETALLCLSLHACRDLSDAREALPLLLKPVCRLRPSDNDKYINAICSSTLFVLGLSQLHRDALAIQHVALQGIFDLLILHPTLMSAAPSSLSIDAASVSMAALSLSVGCSGDTQSSSSSLGGGDTIESLVSFLNINAEASLRSVGTLANFF